MQPSRIRHGRKRRAIEKEQQARLRRYRLALRICEERERKRRSLLSSDEERAIMDEIAQWGPTV